PTLTITVSQALNLNKYRAVFTNVCGTATSTTTTLAIFDTCLQDDTAGTMIQWNATSGDYLFTRCGASPFTLSGKGTVGFINGMRTLQDKKSDRQINASFNTGTLVGNAIVNVIFGQGLIQTFKINQTKPHATCVCASASASPRDTIPGQDRADGEQYVW